jgi:hypothetical protein
MEEMRVELAALTRKELQALAKQGKTFRIWHRMCSYSVLLHGGGAPTSLDCYCCCCFTLVCCPHLLASEGIRANGRSADIIETLLQAAFPEFFPESEPLTTGVGSSA